MTTPDTIPELVARLRGLHNARRYPTETLVATIRDDQSAQVYATSTGPMRVVRPVAETTVDHADLIAETLNALPALLDALDHIGEANKMVGVSDALARELARMRSNGFTGIRGRVLSVAQQGPHELRTVEYDVNGYPCIYAEAEETDAHSGAPPRVAPLSETVHLLQNVGEMELFRIGLREGDEQRPAHSPDGGKMGEFDEEQLLRVINKLRDQTSGHRERIAHLESLTTWRPITQVPTAEEHAWCGGRYLFDDSGSSPWVRVSEYAETVAWMRRNQDWVRRWLPIPPSAGGSEEG